jgi:sec-independent protein translocase protein TatA
MEEIPLFAFFGMPGHFEMLIVLIVAVLLFGKRLPEVARSLGKGIVEFKKGVSGVEDEIDRASTESISHSTVSASSSESMDDRQEATAPKFEPPAGEPKPQTVED